MDLKTADTELANNNLYGRWRDLLCKRSNCYRLEQRIGLELADKIVVFIGNKLLDIQYTFVIRTLYC